MRKVIHSFLLVILFTIIAICENKISAQLVMMPSQNAGKWDTVRFEAGAPLILFFYPYGSGPVETWKPLYAREWNELKSHYGNKVNFRSVTSYSIVFCGERQLDLRDTNTNQLELFYWSGNNKEKVITLKEFMLSTEQIAKIRNESYTSSYLIPYNSDLAFIRQIISPGKPSQAMIDNIPYFNNLLDHRTRIYFPQNFFNLDSILNVTLMIRNQEEKRHITFNPDKTLDSVNIYNRDELQQTRTFTYKNGLPNTFTSKRTFLSEPDEYYHFTYHGDTLIQYSESEYNTTVVQYLLSGSVFIKLAEYDLSHYLKQLNKTIYDVSTNTEGGIEVYYKGDLKYAYPHTHWQLPNRQIIDRHAYEYSWEDDTRSILIFKESFDSKLHVHLMFEMENQLPVKAGVPDKETLITYEYQYK